MKPLWISGALLLIMFLIGGINGAVFSQFDRTMNGYLQASQQAVAEQDWQKASHALNAANHLWENYDFYLHVIANHNEIDEAETFFQESRLYLLQKDPNKYQISTHALLLQIEHLCESQKFTWKNFL